MAPRPQERKVLLLSCYELGHQPLGLAFPLAFFERAGIEARGVDLAVEPLDEESVREADFIGISVPMHTALRLALELVPRIRRWNPEAPLVFYGLYATLNAELLLATGASAVLSGEHEEALVTLASAGASSAERRPDPFRKHLDFPVPSRGRMAGLDRYAHIELPSGERRKVGAVETSRGCLHLCRHCPIPPIYGGRFFVVPKKTVLEDVRQLVAAGADHIDFTDPDFLNGPGHALAVTEAIHREFPELTFDFTAKIEHLVKHRSLLPELAERGCLFVVSAVESLSDWILRELDKGHTREDVFEALAATREAGIALRPTFVPYTPWSRREDIVELFRWIGQEGLVSHVDPIQLTLRLLVPPGSLLLENPSVRPHLGPLDPRALTYRWTHPDPEMDRLQRASEAQVEREVARGSLPHAIFHDLATLALGNEEAGVVSSPGERSPRLTESWFC